MNSPSSRAGLIDYCLRRLGAPVIEINVAPEQLEDRIDDAIQFFQTYHSDSMVKVYRKYQITDQDITNQYVTIPNSIHSVSKVFPLVNTGVNSSLWGVKFQMYLNDIYDLRVAGTMVNFEMTKMYMDMLDMLLNGNPPIQFNRFTNQLRLSIEWGKDILAGNWILIECYESVDPSTWTTVYNDMYLKKYATALIKQQWANNIKKYSNIQLVGGVTLNGQLMYEEAEAEIQQIETEVHSRFEAPPEFFVG